MSFIFAGCMLFLALLVSIVLDNGGIRRWQQSRHDVSAFDAW